MLCPGGGFWLVSAADFSPLFFFFWVDRRRVVLKEIRRCGLKFAVAGIPQTIDNYILVIDKSFGFDTTIEEAQRAIIAAHVEFDSIENGFGLVKLLGRYSGYIAMYATLASRDVDCCLILESPFYLEGPTGPFDYIEKRLKENKHDYCHSRRCRTTKGVGGIDNHYLTIKAVKLNGEIVDQNELREKELPFVQDVEAKVKELTQIIPGLNNHQMSLKASIKKMEEKAKEMHEKLWF
ncbi:hypothetical protein RHMOL_Rhmol02G0143200 [Rhododendron molle]|uniref:Uncharacterized protein n=1 Tax=Rhododendron molle TaxID=49168 RepID=A0ACC0PQE5_RHOML|nr:hypothetical protein RHMOL_Rhmol02G0143200 [Rhododendron molle]